MSVVELRQAFLDVTTVWLAHFFTVVSEVTLDGRAPFFGNIYGWMDACSSLLPRFI